MKRLALAHVSWDIADVWRTLPEYRNLMATFSEFQERVLSLYPGAGEPPAIPRFQSRTAHRGTSSDFPRRPASFPSHIASNRRFLSVFSATMRPSATASAFDQRLRVLEQQVRELRRAASANSAVYVAPMASSYRRTVLGPSRATAVHFMEKSRDYAFCCSAPPGLPPIVSHTSQAFLLSPATSRDSSATTFNVSALHTSSISPATASTYPAITPLPSPSFTSPAIASPAPAKLLATPVMILRTPATSCDPSATLPAILPATATATTIATANHPVITLATCDTHATSIATPATPYRGTFAEATALETSIACTAHTSRISGLCSITHRDYGALASWQFQKAYRTIAAAVRRIRVFDPG